MWLTCGRAWASGIHHPSAGGGDGVSRESNGKVDELTDVLLPADILYERNTG